MRVDSSLEAELAVTPLRMALVERRPQSGLVRHSDRGVQYASQAYTELLKQHQVQISMSRKGNPYDNAACESFMKTLKHEEVYRTDYRDFREARSRIGEFLERVYNWKRLHSALGYVPPAVRTKRRVGAQLTGGLILWGSSNGDYPLNFVSHSRGSLQRRNLSCCPPAPSYRRKELPYSISKARYWKR